MNDGGHAFPGQHTEVRRAFGGRQHLGFGESVDHYSEQEVAVQHGGMSLRDYFAAKAMESLIVTMAQAAMATGKHPGNKMIAEMAYGYADCMIAARGKQP